MNNISRTAALLLFVPLTTTVSAQLQTQGAVPLHHFDLSCDTCHTAPADTELNLPVQNEAEALLKADVSRSCTLAGCHTYDPSMNHPTGVFADSLTSMPLDSDSRITCLTCHFEASRSVSDDYTNDSQEAYLTVPDGIELCITCHAGASGNDLQQAHWQFSGRAHLGSITVDVETADTGGVFVGDIDGESRMCLSCHDNVRVSIPQDHEPLSQRNARRRNMTDHPIGMDYRLVSAERSWDFKHTVPNSRIRLFDGRVGCGSCHSLYSDSPGRLVDEVKRGELCRECHNK